MNGGETVNVGIVGCGLIGQKRARALAGAKLAACADAEPRRAAQLSAQNPGCEAAATWTDLVRRPDVQTVIVATPHDALAEITTAALQNGKHVLVEKPAATKVSDLDRMIATAKKRFGSSTMWPPPKAASANPRS